MRHQTPWLTWATSIEAPNRFILLLAFHVGFTAMGALEAAVPSLQIESAGTNVLIHYSGTLLSASNLDGPYRRIAGATTPHVAPVSGDHQFWTLLGPGVTTLAARLSRTAALRADGTLWTWGENGSGQLGNGSTNLAASPQSILPNATWRTLAAGYYHTAAVAEDGTLWTWGDNDTGQLGNGTGYNSPSPQLIQSNVTWKALAAGYRFTLAVRADGTLWAWGNGTYGQLGIGTSPGFVYTPQPVQPEARWIAVAAGLWHSVGIQADGSLWGWGNNVNGQSVTTPSLVQTNSKWRAVAAGEAHTVALREDGTLWAWGDNRFGELGNGMDYLPARTPQLVQTNVSWKALAAGSHHTVALQENGTLWAWGYNGFGQLGSSASSSITNAPQPIATNMTWTAVAAGEYHTLALRTDGTLWAWGDNRKGQFGIGFRSAPTNAPQQILGGAVW